MAKSDSSKHIPHLSVSSVRDSLWASFRQGDKDALAIIYRKYIDDLYQYGMHFCKDAERVKDCLQDLFTDLWVDREHLSPAVANVRYYLISSLRRRLLRSIKKDNRFVTNDLSDSYFDIELTPPHEEAIIRGEYNNEQIDTLKKAINTLSRRQKEAVYLRFYQNLSYSEIANVMSMKVESVYNLISKAIGILKGLLFPLLLFFMLLINK